MDWTPLKNIRNLELLLPPKEDTWMQLHSPIFPFCPNQFQQVVRLATQLQHIHNFHASQSTTFAARQREAQVSR
jgi:hypothetical protein